jgi:hypothetical protein
MKVKISPRSRSYAVYIYDYDDDSFAERMVRIFTKNAAWLQEIYVYRYKIVVVRHVS